MDSNFISNSNQFLKTIIEKLHTDILFECFAMLLVKTEQIEASSIHILPKENYKRNYKNDIITIPKDDIHDKSIAAYLEDNEDSILKIYTSRSAILDYLPENLYASADNSLEFVDEQGKKRTLEEVKKYREAAKAQLKNTRLFFNPLEVEYNKVRLERELQEFAYLENFDQLFEALWETISPQNEQWSRFLKTLHLVPFILGDKIKTQALIEFVLDRSIHLDFSIEEVCPISSEQQQALMGKEQLLGFNTTVGNCIYDYLDIATLTLKNLSTAEFFEYQQATSKHKKLLEEIIKYYFPLNLDVRLDYSIDTTKDPPVKAEKKVFVLGYSTVLVTVKE